MPAKVVVLGGGVGGTLTANLIARKARDQASVTVIDETAEHVYQPGFLYVALGQESPVHLTKPERHLLNRNIELVADAVIGIDHANRAVELAGGRSVRYDYLVVATGSRTVMDEVPGAEDAQTFYTMAGATRLYLALEEFAGGKIVVGVAGIPYKCPPAPVEFVFMLDDYLRSRKIRDRSEITLCSPLNRAFTIEATSKLVQPILAERGIELATFFNVETVDPERKMVNSLEGEEMPYDLLVLVPPHRGQEVIETSGLGDERGWIPVDRHTLRHASIDRIWALGDATDLPISKSGSVAHFQAPVVAGEIVAEIKGVPFSGHEYEGRVMCFLETGHGEATTIRFDYEHAPVSPSPARTWHWAKALFNKTYFHTVPQGRLPD